MTGMDRQHAPAAARADQVAHSVDDLAELDLTRAAPSPKLGHEGRDHLPLLVCQIRRIPLGLPGDLGHPATALLGPHPKLESHPKAQRNPFPNGLLRPHLKHQHAADVGVPIRARALSRGEGAPAPGRRAVRVHLRLHGRGPVVAPGKRVDLAVRPGATKQLDVAAVGAGHEDAVYGRVGDDDRGRRRGAALPAVGQEAVELGQPGRGRLGSLVGVVEAVGGRPARRAARRSRSN